jgi:hypothetical protein
MAAKNTNNKKPENTDDQIKKNYDKLIKITNLDTEDDEFFDVAKDTLYIFSEHISQTDINVKRPIEYINELIEYINKDEEHGPEFDLFTTQIMLMLFDNEILQIENNKVDIYYPNELIQPHIKDMVAYIIENYDPDKIPIDDENNTNGLTQIKSPTVIKDENFKSMYINNISIAFTDGDFRLICYNDVPSTNDDPSNTNELKINKSMKSEIILSPNNAVKTFNSLMLNILSFEKKYGPIQKEMNIELVNKEEEYPVDGDNKNDASSTSKKNEPIMGYV